MRVLSNWGLRLLLVCAAMGCGGPSAKESGEAAASDQPAGKRKYRIAVIPKGTLHDFWKSIHAGARKAEQELGNVEVIWKGPAREDDREQQIQVVENFVNSGVDAIVLAPLDRKSLVGAVEDAVAKKIPVVVIDSALDYDGIQSYVATNNHNGGVVAARRMGELLGGKGRVVVLRYQVGSASTEAREEGFIETIKKEFPKIEILSDEQHAGATREDALATAENLLTRFGDKIDGWFCPCEPVTFGTLRAFQNSGKVGKIKLVGFDTASAVVASLRKGELQGLVVQDPVNMGYLGVKTAVDVLEGKTVPKEISTGENLITPENMDQEKYQTLHSPDLSKWLAE